MKRTFAANVAVMGLLALTSPSLAAAAKSNGLMTSRPFPASKSAPVPHPAAPPNRVGHRQFPVWSLPWAPYYGGPDYAGGELVEADAAPPGPPSMLSCKRSQQAVTVPSWDGGTKEVRVTRC
jgi:hypothetical protein